MSRMLERFQGDEGRDLRIEAFLSQTIVGRDTSLAEELADLAELLEYDTGQTLIEQNAEDNDIFLIVSGSFGIHVNGRRIGARGRGDHVGEMAAVEPTQRRSATVVADEPSIVGKLTSQQFASLGKITLISTSRSPAHFHVGFWNGTSMSVPSERKHAFSSSLPPRHGM